MFCPACVAFHCACCDDEPLSSPLLVTTPLLAAASLPGDTVRDTWGLDVWGLDVRGLDPSTASDLLARAWQRFLEYPEPRRVDGLRSLIGSPRGEFLLVLLVIELGIPPLDGLLSGPDRLWWAERFAAILPTALSRLEGSSLSEAGSWSPYATRLLRSFVGFLPEALVVSEVPLAVLCGEGFRGFGVCGCRLLDTTHASLDAAAQEVFRVVMPEWSGSLAGLASMVRRLG